MIRNLFASTAIAALLATGALAQTTTQPAEPAPSATTPAQDAAPAAPEATQAQTQTEGQLATNMIGETVYNGTSDDAENIGEVNDVVISNDGMAQSIIVGVGGFLGIGEKNVAIDFKEMSWADRDGDRWIVVEMTKEQIESLPDFDRTAYDPAPAVATTDQPADTSTETTTATPPAATTQPDTTAEAPADNAGQTDTMAAAPTDDNAAAPADDSAAQSDTMAAAPTDDNAAAPADDSAAQTDTMAQDDTNPPAATAPADNNAAATDPGTTAAIDRTTLTEIPAAELRAEDLIGTTVYGADDANIGEIGDVILSTDQSIEAIIIDVGGFLGVGEKEVAVSMDQLQFMRDTNNNRYLYTTFTKEQLDAAPAYDEATFAQNRDQQLLRVQ